MPVDKSNWCGLAPAFYVNRMPGSGARPPGSGILFIREHDEEEKGQGVYSGYEAVRQ